MTERQIRLFGDPVLRSKADPITVKPGETKDIVKVAVPAAIFEKQ